MIVEDVKKHRIVYNGELHIAGVGGIVPILSLKKEEASKEVLDRTKQWEDLQKKIMEINKIK